MPPRLTNLIQPADFVWFAPFKKAYRNLWMEWFINDVPSLTVNNNRRSPGYKRALQWLNQIWCDFNPDLIKRSFELCGITEHESIENHQQSSDRSIYNLEVNVNNLHLSLRHILREKLVIHDYIDFDMELTEAEDFATENTSDLVIEQVIEVDKENDPSAAKRGKGRPPEAKNKSTILKERQKTQENRESA